MVAIQKAIIDINMEEIIKREQNYKDHLRDLIKTMNN